MSRSRKANVYRDDQLVVVARLTEANGPDGVLDVDLNISPGSDCAPWEILPLSDAIQHGKTKLHIGRSRFRIEYPPPTEILE